MVKYQSVSKYYKNDCRRLAKINVINPLTLIFHLLLITDIFYDIYKNFDTAWFGSYHFTFMTLRKKPRKLNKTQPWENLGMSHDSYYYSNTLWKFHAHSLHGILFIKSMILQGFDQKIQYFEESVLRHYLLSGNHTWYKQKTLPKLGQ